MSCVCIARNVPNQMAEVPDPVQTAGHVADPGVEPEAGWRLSLQHLVGCQHSYDVTDRAGTDPTFQGSVGSW